MTAGHFAFKQYPEVPRVCDDCGKRLKRADVAEVKEFPRMFFRCKACAFPQAVSASTIREA